MIVLGVSLLQVDFKPKQLQLFASPDVRGGQRFCMSKQISDRPDQGQ